jgi:subtilisin-like proprotein convertase family protein
VTGLTGTGLVLQNNHGDNLAIKMDGSFEFPTKLATGTAYDVTVLTPPANPAQSCTVSGAKGTVGKLDVTSVAVTCSTAAYNVGGTVVGLEGSGLVLQDNGGDDLTVGAADAGAESFTFATKIPSGSAYKVTVSRQPTSPAQKCVVSGGTGTIVAGDITSVTVNCLTSKFTVGGTVTGLAGTLVLENNHGDDLTLNANGSFAFATPLDSGAVYAVTIKGQPSAPSQTCLVANATGTVTGANVIDVSITCTTNSFTIGGTVTGLRGTGLVLQNNGGDNLQVNPADGGDVPFTFATPLTSGTAYLVQVLSQPTNPVQTCTVSGGADAVGAANVTSVVVKCSTSAYTVGGSVSGLVGSGLVLENNLADDLAVSGNTPFTFATPIASGSRYSVTVKTQPTNPNQTCTVANPSGVMGASIVTNVGITCSTLTYTIGGTVTGLFGSGMVLADNGGDPLPITGNGPFTFPTALAQGSPFAVTVQTQPGVYAQSCTVSNGSGTVSGNVSNIGVSCGSVTSITLSGTGGAIADGTSADCTVPGGGTPFTSTIAIAGNYFNIGTVTVTLSNLSHTYSGDLVANLTKVGGPSVDLFNRLGRTNTQPCASADPLSGIYAFSDTFTGNLWSYPTDGSIIYPPGNYYATTTAGTQVFLTSPNGFSGQSTQGSWRLTLVDYVKLDTGSLGGWTLVLTP